MQAKPCQWRRYCWRVALIGGQPGTEGTWKRAACDTGTAAHSLAFVVAEVLAGGVSAASGALILADPAATTLETALVSGLSVVIGLVVVLVALFAVSLLRAPFKQRDEARRQITPGFPRHALTIEPAWYGDLDIGISGDGPGEDRVIFVPINYTNREPAQRASLEFGLFWQRSFGDGSRSPPSRMLPYTRKRIDSALDMPVAVAPETTVRGHVQFDASLGFAFDFEEGGTDVSVNDYFRVRLDVFDHVSGARMERELPPPRSWGERKQQADSTQQGESP
jgi:hypothetical protein